MDQEVSRVSAFDRDVLRSAFRKAIVEEIIPEDRWQEYAAQMVRDFIGSRSASVDPELLDWIVRK